MDIIQLGAQLLNDKLGLKVELGTIQSALSGLMGDGKGGIDLPGLVAKLTKSGNLETLVGSWLGDGKNLPISADDITGLFGKERISDFAGKVGTDAQSAAGGLADMLPQLIDRFSSGGNLLESSGLGGLMGAAKSLLS